MGRREKPEKVGKARKWRGTEQRLKKRLKRGSLRTKRRNERSGKEDI